MLITDSDPDSTYFEVAELPGYLTGGKNLLLLGGNNQLLRPGTNIEVEVTDKFGNPVYHEVNQYIEAGTNKRAVSIYVYETTPQGIGWITIAGEADKRPNGSSVPKGWQDTLNVKWTKRIRIYPFRENRTRVILQRPPVIKIKELVREYLVPEGGITTMDLEISGSNISYDFTPASDKGAASAYIISAVPYFSASMEGSSIQFNNIVPNLDNTSTQTQTLTEPSHAFHGNSFNAQIDKVINETKARINFPYTPRITTEVVYPPEPHDSTMGTA